MFGRIIGYGVLVIVLLVVGVIVASQVIRPADLHDFQSTDLYKTSAAQTHPGDTGLLLDLGFVQALGGDLPNDAELDIHVYPNFLPDIRRYAWYPYRDSDQLNITPSWSPEVTSITLDGEPLSSTAPIQLSAKNHGHEVRITAETEDGSRSAEYVILIMPHTFPPLKTQISSAEGVAPGIITGMQAAPNNPTFSIPRTLHLLLYTNGVGDTREFLKKARMQTFDDFLAADLGQSLDLEHREYLPWVNFVLDKNGTPLNYNNFAPRTIYLPFTTSKDEGLLPEQGFIYKEIVQDSADNFAEAITRSFIQEKA
ncbi:MAG: cadherin-like beta sandwich domain-containing protein, partial [Pseudomonadota bacterium]